MKAYQVLLLCLFYLTNGQKVRDMWYRSTEFTRVSGVWPQNCAFPCRTVDETYQSLEIGSVGKPCPNPLPLDYDLSRDISSGILTQVPCDVEEVNPFKITLTTLFCFFSLQEITVCSYCISKKNKTVSLAKTCDYVYPDRCMTKHQYSRGYCQSCTDIWEIPKSELWNKEKIRITSI